MLPRYLDIIQFIGQLEIPGIEEIMLSPAEDKEIETIVVETCRYELGQNSITIRHYFILQSPSTF